MANQLHTGCYGCRYRSDWICMKDGMCTGVVPHETYASTNTSDPNYIPYTPANISIMPDELEVNGVKYRRVQDER